ncbi:MAG: GNAT family N-acetyltransferase [Aristaeellaceae bacterium]
MTELTVCSIGEYPALGQILLNKMRANSNWQEVDGWLAQRVTECGRDGLPQVWLCFDENGEPVGYYALSDHEIIRDCPAGRVWLGIILIFDGHRGKGYSPVMLEHACSQAGACGFTELYLVTEHVQYYERFGFQHIGNAVYEHGLSTKVYWKALAEEGSAG